MNFRLMLIVLISAVGFQVGCTKKQETGSSAQGSGQVVIDGSSTVYPITEAVAEEFRKSYPKVKVSVGISGTGGGFKKFVVGETDINDASRAIKPEEVEAAKASKIEYVEFPVAYDGISIIVHKSNTWVDHITKDELHKIWMPESKVKTWKDVRASWPDRAIKLFGPGTDSGTFDYFTEAINGKSHASRSDFTKSEDDNVLVTGVESEKDSLGFFGFAYYKQNEAKLKIVPVDGGAGPVTPSVDSIRNGSYAPLSRKVFIYVSQKSLGKNEVRDFVRFYLEQAETLVPLVGYVALPSEMYQDARTKLENSIRLLGQLTP